LRHAAEGVSRGLWTEAACLEASRSDFSQLLPNGQATPGYRFCVLLSGDPPTRVGETWFNVQSKGGKVHLWVDWLWIDPAFRRRGLGRQALRCLEDEAARSGADRIGLHVFAENAPAIALYTGLGYAPTSFRMAKPIGKDPAK
ncbi:MAG: GNAT family N-acetyltransferase, partial [Thermoplasmata archaeon]|nr:GNAT family N-acetyltransferase [Thermoplasmata archaeon]